MAMSLNKLDDLKNYHNIILNDLFSDRNLKIFEEIEEEFSSLTKKLKSDYDSFDQKYDQIVSFGEIFSTKIVSAFLNQEQLSNSWIDIRKVFRTDDTYREAKIDFDHTEKESTKAFNFKDNRVFITQGFIGGSKKDL